MQSYREVGVNPSRIFIVNPEGVVKTPAHHQLFNTSYANLASDLVDHIFPPLNLNLSLSGSSGACTLQPASTASFASAFGEQRLPSDGPFAPYARNFSECESDFTVPSSAPPPQPPPTFADYTPLPPRPSPPSEADNFAAHAHYNTFLYWQQLPH